MHVHMYVKVYVKVHEKVREKVYVKVHVKVRRDVVGHWQLDCTRPTARQLQAGVVVEHTRYRHHHHTHR